MGKGFNEILWFLLIDFNFLFEFMYMRPAAKLQQQVGAVGADELDPRVLNINN